MGAMTEILENEPSDWAEDLPRPHHDDHKYTRGHVYIFGGDEMTGAARMASESSMRIGAGICTLIAGEKALPIYKAAAPHIICKEYKDNIVGEIVDSQHKQAFLIGSGYGQENPEQLKKIVMRLLVSGKPLVLDADALTVFADEPYTLMEKLHENVVLTPHEGEFSRLFGIKDEGRIEKASEAARECKAVIILKGAETLIAQRKRLIRNTHASPYLATAGAGDVLAGMIAGLMAQGMNPLKASCAAVWMHGAAALQSGPGMIAPDIIEKIPSILRDFS